jgi:glycosyltransferase involved in cell wall biosynthesis
VTATTVELAVVIPCLNEARTIGRCIEKAQRFLRENEVEGEIVVADNGSSDDSRAIAGRLGARVVEVARRGYGAALFDGIRASRAKYIVMGDADDSYDFSSLAGFLDELRRGADLVMGNRFRGGIAPGAMPWKNRYIGNPVLTAIGRLLFGASVGDFHCGLRAFTRVAFDKMDLVTTGMEFASEMVIKARLHRLRIVEVPTMLHKDGRDRAPHLRPWRDGWRHLRFMLLYSPRWLFLYPGLSLMLIGTVAFLSLLRGPVVMHGLFFDINTMLYSSAAILLGFQLVSFSFFARILGVREGLIPADEALGGLFRLLSLEVGLVLGLLMIAAGLYDAVASVLEWKSTSFGALQPSEVQRAIIPSVTLLMLGCQTVFSSLFLSMLGLRTRASTASAANG